jgi:D-alanyl-D-alanine carboxypeptidase
VLDRFFEANATSMRRGSSGWDPWSGSLSSGRTVALLSTLISIAAARVPAQDSLSSRLEALVAPEFRADGPGGVVLVARDGKPILRRAYGMANVELGVPMRPDHVVKIASVTKEFTAVAVLQLVAQGRVALGDDVRDYLRDFETHGRRITIEQALTHTSGLPNLVDLPDFDSLARRDHGVQALLALTNALPLHFEPGASYRYSDTGYILLGAIIERVSGLRYGDYVEAKIFRPLGMRESYYADDRRIIPRRAAGYTLRDGRVVRAPFMSMTVPHAAGALASTVDDLLRWHLALRRGSVVPQALLQRAWQPRDLPDGRQSGYGFGFQVCTVEAHRSIEHGGFINGFLANALMLPDDGLDIIVLVNSDADSPDAGALARRLARFVLTGSQVPRYETLAPEQRTALTGRYGLGSGEKLDIFERNGVLSLRRGDRPARPLAALSPTELTLADSEGAFLLSFELGPGGRAVKVHISQRCEPVDMGTRVTPT